jgi:hypothetical protein
MNYFSGELPELGDVVRFNDSWLVWWMLGSNKMLVLRKDKFEDGTDSIKVGFICENNEISEIVTNWNPLNFILLKRQYDL